LEFKHNPVLLNECIEGLNIKPDGIYIDGTQPTKTCDVHYLVSMDKSTGQIASEYCPQENIISIALLNVKRPDYVSTADGRYVVKVGNGGNIIYTADGHGSLCSAHTYVPPVEQPVVDPNTGDVSTPPEWLQ